MEPAPPDSLPRLTARRVRALRPVRPRPGADRAQGTLVETERYRDGVRRTATVFLTGAECRFSCVHCDLWQHTLEHGPTPPGALPVQLEGVLADLAAACPGRRDGGVEQLKLYNASNFFDAEAVPPSDDARLLDLLEPFDRVTVECHPALLLQPAGRRRCRRYRLRLPGLEAALGLETAHPQALRRLGKGMDLQSFRRACAVLRAEDVALRVFVLVGTPFVASQEQEEWTVASVREALEQGASMVSLIPVRPGNGVLEELAARGQFTAPSLDLIERSFERALRELEPRHAGGAVQIDRWDLEQVRDRAPHAECAGARVERLLRMSATGRVEPAVRCAVCVQGRGKSSAGGLPPR